MPLDMVGYTAKEEKMRSLTLTKNVTLDEIFIGLSLSSYKEVVSFSSGLLDYFV